MNSLVQKICTFYTNHNITPLADNKLYIERSIQTIARLPKGKHQKILDIGCGNGLNTVLMKALRPDASVFGIDIASLYQRVWSKLSGIFRNLSFIRQNAKKLSFPDNMFDVVTMWGVFEHIGEEQNTLNKKSVQPDALRKKVLREIYRVLKPGGTVCICYLPSSQSPYHKLRKMLGMPHHRYTFTTREMRDLLTRVGFTITFVSYRHMLPLYCVPKSFANRYAKWFESIEKYFIKTPLRFISQDLEITAMK